MGFVLGALSVMGVRFLRNKVSDSEIAADNTDPLWTNYRLFFMLHTDEVDTQDKINVQFINCFISHVGLAFFIIVRQKNLRTRKSKYVFLC